ncbi:hypothetical protein EDB19DRAFT_606060 [Suillus lakei]|nr:hypothetical protein EDB19DRAFT_606060 [Suillus lakei]
MEIRFFLMAALVWSIPMHPGQPAMPLNKRTVRVGCEPHGMTHANGYCCCGLPGPALPSSMQHPETRKPARAASWWFWWLPI